MPLSPTRQIEGLAIARPSLCTTATQYIKLLQPEPDLSRQAAPKERPLRFRNPCLRGR
jgi:hypothetical protein